MLFENRHEWCLKKKKERKKEMKIEKEINKNWEFPMKNMGNF